MPETRGRPSKFTPEIAEEIVERISTGEPLAQICRDDHMPSMSAVNSWRRDDEVFSGNIARARDDGYEAIAADCLAIADETGMDTIYTKDGSRANAEWISRSKLRVETRLKLLAKWDPRRYGDKLALTGGDENDRAIQVDISGLSPLQREALASVRLAGE